MTTLRWQGGAPAVAQVSSATITGYDATTTYTITIGNATVSVLGTGGTATTTAVALLAALQASTIPQFLEVAWTNPSGAIITGTAVTAGVPFTATSSVSGGSGTFGSFSTSVTSSGPNDWSTAANWSTGAVPVSSDTVYIDQTNYDVFYGLAQSSVTLTALIIGANFESGTNGTGTIGLPKTNTGAATGVSAYPEYRPDYLAIGATTLSIGYGNGTGSGRIKINTGSAQTALTQYTSANGIETDLEAVLWKGTHASNTVVIIDGSFAAAGYGGESATIATCQVVGGTVRLGAGCTLTTVSQNDGTATVNSSFTTLTQQGGTMVCVGTGTATTINAYGGTVAYQSNGTITTLQIGSGGTFDKSGDMRALTITNTAMYQGSTLLDPFRTITFTNPLTENDCGYGDVTIDRGRNISVQFANL